MLCSHSKVNSSNYFIHSSDTDEENFFFVIHFQILTELIQLVDHYKECSSTNIFVKLHTEEQQGLSQKLYLEDGSYTWCHGFCSSPKLVFPGKDARGKTQFEINVKLLLAVRESGEGNELTHTLTTMRNVPPAISHQSYNDINLSSHIVYEKAAKESMLAVVKGLKENWSENLDNDIGILVLTEAGKSEVIFLEWRCYWCY